MFWQVIAPKASDANIGYRPLFADTTVEIGKKYFYQMRGRNSSGYSELSEPCGPVTADCRIFIDEMENKSRFYSMSGELRMLPPADLPRARGDRSRLAGRTGDYIVYKIQGKIISLRVDLFITKLDGNIEVQLLSGDSTNTFVPLPITRKIFEPLRNEYKFYSPATISSQEIPADHQYLKIVLAADIQVSRIEVKYEGEK
jgi:hypothetical protein